MTETVTITPTLGNDSDGDPVAQSAPVEIAPLEIAPGNMLIKHGTGGDLADVEFTLYFPLRVYTGNETGWSDTDTLIHDGDEILVRGRTCIALVQVWRSQRGASRGGLAVLARSRSGKAA